MKYKKKVESQLNQVVEECIASGKDSQEAILLLLEKVRKDNYLYDELLGPYEHRAAQELVLLKTQDIRSKIWDSKQNQQSNARVKHLAEVHSILLMDFPLPGGVRLGEATKGQVTEASEYYIRRGKNMLWKGKFLERVAKPMQNNESVKSRFDEKKLQKLHKQEEGKNKE